MCIYKHIKHIYSNIPEINLKRQGISCRGTDGWRPQQSPRAPPATWGLPSTVKPWKHVEVYMLFFFALCHRSHMYVLYIYIYLYVYFLYMYIQYTYIHRSLRVDSRYLYVLVWLVSYHTYVVYTHMQHVITSQLSKDFWAKRLPCWKLQLNPNHWLVHRKAIPAKSPRLIGIVCGRNPSVSLIGCTWWSYCAMIAISPVCFFNESSAWQACSGVAVSCCAACKWIHMT